MQYDGQKLGHSESHVWAIDMSASPFQHPMADTPKLGEIMTVIDDNNEL